MQDSITIQDIKEFLAAYLRPQDFDRLLLAVQSKKEFRLPFKLIERINEIQYVIVSNKNNNFALQFVPDEIALAPLSDTIVPDVIIFVDK